MEYSSTPVNKIQPKKDSTTSLSTENSLLSNNNNSLQPTTRSGLRNSDSWARKRALMHRDYQWTTTVEGVETTTNNNDNNRTSESYNSTVSSDSTRNNDQTKSSTSRKVKLDSKVDSSDSIQNIILRRRRSSRRLPEIPSNCNISSNSNENDQIDENKYPLSSCTSDDYPLQSIHENSIYNHPMCSKSIDSDSSLTARSLYSKLQHSHQSPNTKSVDLSNLTRRKSCLVVNSTLLPQRSLDYPCIVRKAPDLSDIVRQRMLNSKISKQQQGDNFSLSLEREHVPRVPRKIIIRQDNSIEIALR